MSALFSKFQVRYGAKWTSALSSPELIRLAVTEWSEQLAGVTGEQVRRGLAVWDEDWPPSSPQFRKACLGSAGSLHNTAAYRPFVALPQPPRDVVLGRDALAGMRGLLR